MNQPVTITETDTHTDTDQAKLYKSLRDLDFALFALSTASIFDKAEHAELAVKETRNVLSGLVSSVHALKNDIQRMKGK